MKKKSEKQKIKELQDMHKALLDLKEVFKARLVSTPCDLKPEDVKCLQDAITIYDSTGAYGLKQEKLDYWNEVIETDLFLDTRCFVVSEKSVLTDNKKVYHIYRFTPDYKEYEIINFHHPSCSLEDALALHEKMKGETQ